VKKKKTKVQIKSLDSALDEFVSVAKKVASGKKVKPKAATYVADAETARGIFTESRLKLIQTLKESSRTGRHLAAVSGTYTSTDIRARKCLDAMSTLNWTTPYRLSEKQMP
jgi:hypothetical protein